MLHRCRVRMRTLRLAPRYPLPQTKKKKKETQLRGTLLARAGEQAARCGNQFGLGPPTTIRDVDVNMCPTVAVFLGSIVAASLA